MTQKQVTREQALASVREFLDRWDRMYPPRLQARRTWDGDVIHAFSGSFGVVELRISDLRAILPGTDDESGDRS